MLERYRKPKPQRGLIISLGSGPQMPERQGASRRCTAKNRRLEPCRSHFATDSTIAGQNLGFLNPG